MLQDVQKRCPGCLLVLVLVLNKILLHAPALKHAGLHHCSSHFLLLRRLNKQHFMAGRPVVRNRHISMTTFRQFMADGSYRCVTACNSSTAKKFESVSACLDRREDGGTSLGLSYVCFFLRTLSSGITHTYTYHFSQYSSHLLTQGIIDLCCIAW